MFTRKSPSLGNGTAMPYKKTKKTIEREGWMWEGVAGNISKKNKIEEEKISYGKAKPT